MENKLIKVTINDDQQLVSARDLHKGLNLKRHFGDWVKQNFKDFEEGVDFMSAPRSANMPNGGVKRIADYALTIDMAKQLCMMSRTELGKKYRRYFIELERKWNDPQEVVKRGYAILQNENAKLKIENEEMKPKALFADAVSASDTPILIGELAKILKQNGIEIGQNRLFVWLRSKGYLISRNGTDYNTPTQKSMELGLFKIKERTRVSSDGSVKITKTSMVTGKGQQYFVNKFLGDKSSIK